MLTHWITAVFRKAIDLLMCGGSVSGDSSNFNSSLSNASIMWILRDKLVCYYDFHTLGFYGSACDLAYCFWGNYIIVYILIRRKKSIPWNDTRNRLLELMIHANICYGISNCINSSRPRDAYTRQETFSFINGLAQDPILICVICTLQPIRHLTNADKIHYCLISVQSSEMCIDFRYLIRNLIYEIGVV